jgi:hypothetical protein
MNNISNSVTIFENKRQKNEKEIFDFPHVFTQTSSNRMKPGPCVQLCNGTYTFVLL